MALGSLAHTVTDQPWAPCPLTHLVPTSLNRYQPAPTGTNQNKPAPAAWLLRGVKGRHKMSALLHHPQRQVAKPVRV